MRNQEILKPKKEKDKAELEAVEDIRGTPLVVGTMEEMIDDNHCIVSTSNGPEYYVNITSFVDKDQLEPGCTVLMHNKTHTVVGLLADNNDPMVSMMKVEKAPLESYSDIGGLESQIQEIKEAVELPLTHPELYEDIGIKPPKGVILYGQPGTGKTLLAKAVANQTSATFLRIVGSELIQKYLGDGPKLVREVFKVADETLPRLCLLTRLTLLVSRRLPISFLLFHLLALTKLSRPHPRPPLRLLQCPIDEALRFQLLWHARDPADDARASDSARRFRQPRRCQGHHGHQPHRGPRPGPAPPRPRRSQDRISVPRREDSPPHLWYSHGKNEHGRRRRSRRVCDEQG